MIDRIPESFLAEPGAHILLDLDMRILDSGPYFSKVSFRTRDEILGKPLFEAFPPEPHEKKDSAESRQAIRDSFACAVKTKEPNKISKCHLRVECPPSTGGGWADKWWTITHVPLLEDGEVVAVVQRVEDITLEVTTYEMVRNQRLSNYILYAFCVAMVVVITLLYSHGNKTAKHELQTTCEIQARSLPAQHELSHIMMDINQLLISPAQQPQPVPPRVQETIKSLEQHTQNYVEIISQQPKSRECPQK